MSRSKESGIVAVEGEQDVGDMRIGTIGSGMIVRAVLDAVQVTEGIRCEAVYSRDESTGRALAVAYGVRKAYTRLEDLFGDPEVDFVYVASPNDLHYRQARMALENGKNVICEKPMTPTRTQSEDLVWLARERGLLLIDAVPTAFMANFRLVREQLPKIGRVRLVLCNYSQYSSRYDDLKKGEVPNVFSLDHAGGALQDIGFYNVYFNVALFGRPRSAVYHPNRFQGGIDTSGVLVLQYDGFVGSCAGAKDTWGVNFAQIEGEQGFIYVKDGPQALAEIRVVTKTSDETFNEQPATNRWLLEVQGWVERVASGDRRFFDESLVTMLDVVDVMESARKQAGIRFTGE
jgi:predicted dehydrogenase